MGNFNGFERKIASFLSNSPKVKLIIKKSYQIINFILYKESFTFKTDYKLEKVVNTEFESFFGYYDKCPRNGNYELFHQTNFQTKIKPKKVIKGSGVCEVIVFDTVTENVIFKRPTKAFNWQQGSKLQWLDEYKFIYNDIDNDKIVSRIIDLENHKEETLEYPVYDAYKKDYYLSLDYKPLEQLRPDYAYFRESKWKDVDYANQYIKKCYYDGSFVELVSLKEVLTKYPLNFLCDFEKQKFNHIMISPLGDRFIFLHRAYNTDGKRIDRLFLYEVNTNVLVLISDSGMISHYCWIDNNKVISYMNHENENGYFIIDLSDKFSFEKIDILGLDELGDGHPTYIGNDEFITDTYPNKSRMKKLILVNIKSKKIEVLAEFLEPLSYSEQTRCDLHPKWDPEHRSIYIDSVHIGKRGLFKLEIGND